MWKGIANFVAKNPEYKNLFGLVSINREYDDLSRQLIMNFLREKRFSTKMAELVRPRKAPKKTKLRGVEQGSMSRIIRDLNEVSTLIDEIESEQKAVPVLLRQYLRLGGVLLGFNIDPKFGDVLDGLILVDLLDCPIKVLERYMGRSSANSFLAHHGQLPLTKESLCSA